MSDDIRIKKAVYESVKDMFALAVSGSRFKLKSTSYEVQNAKTKIDSGVVGLICQVAYDFVVKDEITLNTTRTCLTFQLNYTSLPNLIPSVPIKQQYTTRQYTLFANSSCTNAAPFAGSNEPV